MGEKLFAMVCFGFLMCAIIVCLYVGSQGVRMLDGLAPVMGASQVPTWLSEIVGAIF